MFFGPSTIASTLAVVGQTMERCGHDADDFYRSIGVDPEQMGLPGWRLPLDVMRRAWLRAFELTKDLTSAGSSANGNGSATRPESPHIVARRQTLTISRIFTVCIGRLQAWLNDGQDANFHFERPGKPLHTAAPRSARVAA